MAFGSGNQPKEENKIKSFVSPLFSTPWQTTVSIGWTGIFANLYVVMVLFFFAGGVISQANNNCGIASIKLDAIGSILFWLMVMMLAATIISFLKPSNLLTLKLFLFGWIGYFAIGEITGYLAILLKDYAPSCRPAVEWGYQVGRTSLIVVLSLLGSIWCFKDNEGEYHI